MEKKNTDQPLPPIGNSPAANGFAGFVTGVATLQAVTITIATAWIKAAEWLKPGKGKSSISEIVGGALKNKFVWGANLFFGAVWGLRAFGAAAQAQSEQQQLLQENQQLRAQLHQTGQALHQVADAVEQGAGTHTARLEAERAAAEFADKSPTVH